MFPMALKFYFPQKLTTSEEYMESCVEPNYGISILKVKDFRTLNINMEVMYMYDQTNNSTSEELQDPNSPRHVCI